MGNLDFKPGLYEKKHSSISLSYPATIQINSFLCSVNFRFNVSIASLENESLNSLFPKE